MRKFVLYLLLAVSLSGCGKRGALIPPEALVPAAVGSAEVGQRGNGFRVSWSAPGREESGRPLQGKLRYRLHRREVLPPGRDCSACPDVWKLLAEADPAVPGSIEQRDGRLTYIDRNLLPDVTYQYRVQAVDASGGVSRPATLPPRQWVTPPFPPVLQALPGHAGVRLEFVAPTSAPRETAVGYLLFRQDATGGTVRQLTPTPLSAVTFDDNQVRLGVTYRYTARTVAVIGGQTVESADSNEAVITVAMPE